MANYTDYLWTSTGGAVTILGGLWVRLHNNNTGTDYYSSAVTDASTGAFTHSAPTGDYSLYSGTAATVGGTPNLRNGHYAVAARSGDDPAFNSATVVGSPSAPAVGLSPGEGATAVNPFNIKAYNAKGDGISRKDGAITSGLAAFTSATGTFTAADVGKLIIVVGAGAAGAVLATTIASFTSATAVGLTATAGTTVTGAEYAYGTDNATAIAATFTAAGAFVEGAINSHVSGNPLQQLSGTVTGPAGTFMTSAGFRAGLGVSVVLDPNCVIKAGALIAGPLLDTSATVLYQEGWIQGGQWDCSDLALYGIYIRQFAHCSFKDFVIQRPRSHFLIFGDPAASSASFEPMLMNVHLWRPPASAVPASSYGLWIQNCTDAKIAQLVVVGADAGIRVDTDVNHFWHCHSWGYPSHVNTIAFDDNGNGNIWLECFADTAATYGWRLRQAQSIIIGGQVYNGPSSGGADNVLVGIHSDAGTGSFEVIGMRFAGSDGAHRIKIDIEGDRTNCHIFGCVQNNVVTANSYDQTPSFYPTLIDSVQQIHVTGKAGGSFPSTSAGIEITYDSTSGTSYIQSYDRGGSAAKFLNLSGSLITLGASSIASNDFRRSRQTPTEAVLVSGVTATAGELVGVTLTAARVVGAPISPSTGQRLTFNLVQGGAGAFAVTWNAAFKGITGGTSGATGTRASFSFDYDGTNWNLNGAQPTWVA